MRKLTAAVFAALACAAVAALPAQAHEGHGSCREAGETAAALAQTLHPLGLTLVSVAARDGGVNEEIAEVHATIC